MIDRPQAIARVLDLFRAHPCVAILGPRQCGKTTLARMICADEPVFHFFDLAGWRRRCARSAPSKG